MRTIPLDNQVQIDSLLHDFVNREVIPGTGVDAGAFWSGWPRSSAPSPRRTPRF